MLGHAVFVLRPAITKKYSPENITKDLGRIMTASRTRSTVSPLSSHISCARCVSANCKHVTGWNQPSSRGHEDTHIDERGAKKCGSSENALGGCLAILWPGGASRKRTGEAVLHLTRDKETGVWVGPRPGKNGPLLQMDRRLSIAWWGRCTSGTL